ncbi:CaiB/BaiF CoA transferase family protein [Denitratisoma oestradiolicum]|uniref:Alpha-methylacyl-CoA racemase n=1 Tax=Denitratisoma oestradiolicum TaxID=311182 RepID=A0A6S6XVI8_9PROT|nr:CaiB/BaiF CoA-transferase family protein [Denitratisoma oestradiolicum]TWO79221.1 carnitine dehydratase [Denitratisoma oestradiolicum]CAB1368223.1 Alpha-methylacyl-CoA racemase [Denitratisoma oestradiolicum]
MATKPLDGVKVLDFTQLLPGPMCTLHLADMGADVLKIEPTGSGEPARGPAGTPISHFFLAVNRNKRSLSINLRAEGAREVILQLVKESDVLVEGFRPGVMARLGLGYEDVKAANPKIVYCAITGYGQDGPLVELGGHDINYQCYAGILEQSSGAGVAPHPGNFPIADLAGGALSSAMTILAALFDAQRSGKGRFLDVSMTDCAMANNMQPVAAMHTYGRPIPPGMDTLTGGLPCYGTYETADGRYLAVGALEPKFWKAFCDAIGQPDLVRAGWASGKDGVAVRGQIAAIIKSKSLDEWNQVFTGVDACVSPVLRVDEVLQHPLTQARQMVVQVPATDGRTYPYFAFPVKMTDYRFSVDRSPPGLGEHNEEVLRKLGYGDDDLARFRDNGLI